MWFVKITTGFYQLFLYTTHFVLKYLGRKRKKKKKTFSPQKEYTEDKTDKTGHSGQNKNEMAQRSSPPPPIIIVIAELISPSKHSTLRSLIQAKSILWGFYIFIL